jgi:regulator of replication initiation timing
LDQAAATITQLYADKEVFKAAITQANNTKDMLQKELEKERNRIQKLVVENGKLKGLVSDLRKQLSAFSKEKETVDEENTELKKMIEELEINIKEIDVGRESLRSSIQGKWNITTTSNLSVKSYVKYLTKRIPEVQHFYTIFRSRMSLSDFNALVCNNLHSDCLLKLVQFVSDLVSSELQKQHTATPELHKENPCPSLKPRSRHRVHSLSAEVGTKESDRRYNRETRRTEEEQS